MLSRQTIKYILLTSLIFISLLLVVVEWICRTSSGCKCNPYSFSKESTIEDGAFINSYYSIPTSIQIPGTKDSIIFDSAWTAYAQTKKRFLGLCLFENDVVIKDFSGNTFSTPITISKNAKAFAISFTPQAGESYSYGDIYEHQENNRSETMHLQLAKVVDTVKIFVADLDTSIKNRIDTILFVKRK